MSLRVNPGGKPFISNTQDLLDIYWKSIGHIYFTTFVLFIIFDFLHFFVFFFFFYFICNFYRPYLLPVCRQCLAKPGCSYATSWVGNASVLSSRFYLISCTNEKSRHRSLRAVFYDARANRGHLFSDRRLY